MAFDTEKAQAYVNDLMRKLSDDPDSLEKHELRFATKYRQTELNRANVEREVKDLQNQITQAQARVRSLELQYESDSTRMESILDALVTLKFEADLDPVDINAAGPNGKQMRPVDPPSKASRPTKKKSKRRGAA